MGMKTLYLGPIYDLSHVEGKDTSYSEVARIISEKNIVAMFQGRSEAGPRALGNRSILYDPRDPNGKDHVNTIKRRESFRPFAGTVLKEYVNGWFDMAGIDESPFMMYAVDALEYAYDKIPAILHVDKTCRIQTITKEQNEHYYNLIEAFYRKTRVPILFNTSFNLAGEPLVETLEDALKTFHNSDINYLYFPEVQKLIVK
jgi:carbamoyltransferase